MSRFRSVGLGGGGAMYQPRFSPWLPTGAEPQVMFVACDMNGLYRSADGGVTWTLIDDRTIQGSTRFSVAFDPQTPGRVIGFHSTFGLRLSTDYGRTFRAHPVALPTGFARVTSAVFSGAGTLVVGTEAGLYRLAGATWTHLTTSTGGVVIGDVLALAASAVQQTWCFALTAQDVLWSNDDGATWWPCNLGLTGARRSLAVADSGGQVVLFAALAGSLHCVEIPAMAQPSNPPTWTDVTDNIGADVNVGAGLVFREVAVSAAAPNTIYVAAQNPAPDTSDPYATVFAGTYDPANSTVNWRWAYDGFEKHSKRNLDPGWADLDPPRGRGWGFGGTPLGLSASRLDANIVALTNLAVVHRSDNGAQQNAANAWRERYSRQQAQDRWITRGLDVSTVWHHYRYSDTVGFIASTDFGLARSGDGGDSWEYVGVSDGRTRRNNCYELAQAGGRRIAAVSERQDIPHRKALLIGSTGHGAVLSSLDDGRTWTTVAGATMAPGSNTWTVDTTSGLPDGPVVSLIANGTTLYASVWGRGVVWSDDLGVTWSPLGTFSVITPLCHRLSLDSAGNLFCATAAQLQPTLVQGALWRLPASAIPGTVGAVTAAWENKTASLGTVSIADFAFDPADSQRIFACSESVGPGVVGGLFHSRDGGLTWTPNLMPISDPRIATYHPSSLQAFSPAIINDRLFVSTLYNGIWSSDYDPTNPSWTPNWVEFKALPFAGAQRIASRISSGGSRSELLFSTYGAGAWELQRECLFINDHSSVSRYEVEAQLNAGQQTADVSQVALLILDGFAGAEVGVTANAVPQVSVSGMNTGGVTAQLAPAQTSDPDLERPQRLTMRCDLHFTDLAAFPTSVGQSNTLTLRFKRGQYECSTQIKLVYPDHPYILDGAAYWLSDGVRVFRATEGQARFGATPPVSATPADIPANALAYLRDVLTALNKPNGGAIWAQMPTDQLESALQIWPKDDQGRNVLNFVVAKLTYRGAIDATAVRVFFRLCAVMATGLDFDPNSAYRSFDPTGGAVPIVPRLGLTTNAATGDREITTLPCFADSRVNTDGSRPNPAPQSMDAQPDPMFTIPAPGAAAADFYVGAWLDLNQPADKHFPKNPRPAAGEGPWNTDPSAPETLLSVEELVKGRHQCLIAEVHHRFQGGADTLAPGDGPSTTQYLSQRNLAILGSDNPGGTDAHTIIHPFDLRGRAGRPTSSGGEEVLVTDRPDELLLWWDDVPRATEATLTFSGITADEVLTLNDTRPRSTRLERVDAETIRCPVGGLASVPLPNRDENIAGLLTLVLPQGLGPGRRFGCRLQQLGAPEQAIIGAFSIAIPVAKAAELLLDAANTLAVMRHIARLQPEGDRWASVLQRYARVLAARVDGLGGNAQAVEASPYGAQEPPPRQREPGRWIVRLLGALASALRRLLRRHAH
jgi:hypothetical protein